MYGIDIVPIYISSMLVAYGSSRITSYSSEMSKILYVPLVSLVHKSTFSTEFKSSLTINFSLRVNRYNWMTKIVKI